jgi:hypothetical protein
LIDAFAGADFTIGTAGFSCANENDVNIVSMTAMLIAKRVTRIIWRFQVG